MSRGGPPEIAVVTASRGRHDALIAKAESLRAQSLDPSRFVWSIWLNETTPSVEEMRARFAAMDLPFDMHLAGGEDLPVGRARNRASEAVPDGTKVLLISDDDVTHDRGALAAHVALHDRFPRAIGVGGLRLPDALRSGTRREPFEQRASALGRAPWIQFSGANTSVPGDAYEQVGGYDPDWTGYGGEDPELALRLRAVGCSFRTVPGGGGFHHGRVADDLDKAYLAGGAHVRVALRHPVAGVRWWLGVHPVQIAIKLAVLGLVRPFAGDRGQSERAYSRGARDAWRGAHGAQRR